MERLTEKVNDYWKTNDKAHIYYLDTNESVFVGNVIDRLAEFEDFMENNKYNSLLDLQADLAILAVTKLTLNLTAKENQALKDRWDKLKEYLKETYEYFDQYENMEDCASGYENTLNEMQELEKDK